jgi:hypothetical protein
MQKLVKAVRPPRQATPSSKSLSPRVAPLELRERELKHVAGGVSPEAPKNAW